MSGQSNAANLELGPRRLQVYLAGEIHSDWRDEIAGGLAEAGLVERVQLTGPVTDHDASDHVGRSILGEQPTAFWADHISAKINGVRTGTALRRADVVIVRFGEKYRQWNAAFDAGRAVARGIPLIVIHPREHEHALKEIAAAAAAVCETPQQAVAILRYVVGQQ